MVMNLSLKRNILSDFIEDLKRHLEPPQHLQNHGIML
jgi:hypothetical protein